MQNNSSSSTPPSSSSSAPSDTTGELSKQQGKKPKLLYVADEKDKNLFQELHFKEFRETAKKQHKRERQEKPTSKPFTFVPYRHGVKRNRTKKPKEEKAEVPEEHADATVNIPSASNTSQHPSTPLHISTAKPEHLSYSAPSNASTTQQILTQQGIQMYNSATTSSSSNSMAQNQLNHVFSPHQVPTQLQHFGQASSSTASVNVSHQIQLQVPQRERIQPQDIEGDTAEKMWSFLDQFNKNNE